MCVFTRALFDIALKRVLEAAVACRKILIPCASVFLAVPFMFHTCVFSSCFAHALLKHYGYSKQISGLHLARKSIGLSRFNLLQIILINCPQFEIVLAR